jgi:hypothetical protein
MRFDFTINEAINQRILDRVKDDVFEALQVASEALLTEANNTVPFDDGILKASGKTSSDKTTMTTMVSYDTPYAVDLHENPQYNFQGNGRGKWLELTLNEQRQDLIRLIQQKIEASINRGGGI